MIQIQEHPIETTEVLSAVHSELAGAIVLFLGTTRKFTGNHETASLEYECYREMAIKKLEQLRESAILKWQLNHCSLVHRTGLVPIGEASVAVAVSSPHRVAAFEAAQWLIDTLKQEVPIWKKECYANGATEWIHPV